MEERRIAKMKNDKDYNKIHRDIRNKIKQTKKKIPIGQCQEAERLHEMYDTFNFPIITGKPN